MFERMLQFNVCKRFSWIFCKNRKHNNYVSYRLMGSKIKTYFFIFILYDTDDCAVLFKIPKPRPIIDVI